MATSGIKSKSRRNGGRGRWVVVAFLIALIGVPSWLTYREVQRERRNAALIAAVKQSDFRAVVSLLQQGADPNARDVTSEKRSFWELFFGFGGSRFPTTPTALLVALGWHDSSLSTFTVVPENVAIVKALLDGGADVNAEDIHGDTALLMAAWTQKHDTLRLLLDRGANLNARDHKGETAWRLTYMLGDTQNLVTLLNRGVPVNEQDSAGVNALLWNAAQGHVGAVRVLLAHHADVNTKDGLGKTALYYAHLYHRKTVEQILRQAGAKE